MRKIYNFKQLAWASALALTAYSCKPPLEDVEPTVIVPSTYNFTNVSYSGQTTRQNMSVELMTLIRTAHTGAKLDSATLATMYRGTGFSNDALNTSGKNLYSKTSIAYQSKIDSYLGELARVSQNPDSAYQGVAGKVTVAGKTILVNASGFEYKELIEKGFMGAIFLDQAVNNYLANIALDDNITVKEGEGTAMQHHWDEAYGYFADNANPLDTTKGALRYWGNYSKGINPVAQTTDRLSTAFKLGRIAINENKLSEVIEARDAVIVEWRRLAACMAVKYINSTLKSYSDLRSRLHTLTELYGFLNAINIAGGNATAHITKLETETLYGISEEELQAISNDLATTFGLSAIQSNL